MKTLLTLLALTLPLLGQAPTRVASYGPNGTHWPELIDTPFLYETQPNDIVVAPNWNTIESAIRSLTAAQVSAGVRILVQSGTLTGGGTGGAATSVLQDVGDPTWTKRVTICPEDGYGTVTLSGGHKFLRAHSVCLAGFNTDGVKWEGCRRSAMAWCKMGLWMAIYGDEIVADTEMFEAVEGVQPNSSVQNGDSQNIYSAGGDLTDVHLDGCYFSPRYFAVPYTGAKPHTDTLQFSTPLGGTVSDVSFRDCAYFSSNNCSIQTGGVLGMSFDNCYVVSGSTSLSRYPHLSGGSTEATTNAFNGAGGQFSSVDSVFIGGMALSQGTVNNPWSSVTNTLTDRVYAGYLQPLSGSWTVNTGLNETNSGMPVFPTDTYLTSIWVDGSAPPATQTNPPAISPANTTLGIGETVAISATPSGAVIYYTVDGTAPTTSSPVYVGPISITGTQTVTAVALSAPLTISNPSSRTYTQTGGTQTTPPVISPANANLGLGQTVTISASPLSATIYYTLDGTPATTSSPVYAGPFSITGTQTVNAVALAAPLTVSNQSSRTYTQTNTLISTGDFDNLPATGSGTEFYATWCAEVDQNNADLLIGFADDDIQFYDEMAAIVRFAPSGNIDVRNGGAYGADVVFPYSANTQYEFELMADITNKTYDVNVRLFGSPTWTVLADDYAFRTEEATSGMFTNMVLQSVIGELSMTKLDFTETPIVTAPTKYRLRVRIR